MPPSHTTANKKAGVAEHTEVLDHAGLLVNKPPSTAGLLFNLSSSNFNSDSMDSDTESQAGQSLASFAAKRRREEADMKLGGEIKGA